MYLVLTTYIHLHLAKSNQIKPKLFKDFETLLHTILIKSKDNWNQTNSNQFKPKWFTYPTTYHQNFLLNPWRLEIQMKIRVADFQQQQNYTEKTLKSACFTNQIACFFLLGDICKIHDIVQLRAAIMFSWQWLHIFLNIPLHVSLDGPFLKINHK